MKYIQVNGVKVQDELRDVEIAGVLSHKQNESGEDVLNLHEQACRRNKHWPYYHLKNKRKRLIFAVSK